MIQSAADGLESILQLETFGYLMLGILVGFAVGILPGLGGNVSLALMLPFTYNMDTIDIFALLLGNWATTETSGDITSVLFGIPGEGTAAATVLDGFPMTKSGQAGRALGAVLTSSVFGGVFGMIVLVAAIPILRPLVLAFGPPEFFMLVLLGLAFVVALSGRYLLKGFIMAALGLLVSLVGVDPNLSVPRYTFGMLYLWDGVPVVPLLVGLFGGAEVVQLMLTKGSIARQLDGSPRVYRGIWRGVRDTFQHWWLVTRCSLIGIGIGATPGLGGSVSQWIAYGHAQQTSKRPELFGRGSVEGVVAAGATNNAKDAGALIPTIGLGIPGSNGMAIILLGFTIAGVAPGPEMLTTNLDITFSMVWIVVITNVIAVVLALAILGQLARLTFIPGFWLVPSLLVLLTIGAYSTNFNFNDVVVMVIASVLGVACIRWNWPRVPFVLAVVLGQAFERNLYLSYSIHGWSWLLKPSVLVLGAIIVLALVKGSKPARQARRERRKAQVAA